MKIAVIAANGRSGQAFVELALKHGHKVTGGIYGKSFLPDDPNLKTMECDATKPSDLERLIKGQDAVISLIGHVKGSPPNVQTDAITHAANVMKRLGVRRIVSLTGTGVRFPGDKVTLLDRFLNFGLSIADPERLKDGRAHVKVLESSGLDWTVIRVLKLQNIAPKPYALKLHGPTKPVVGRQEVAGAIMEVLENSSFIKEAPIIAKP